MSLVSFRLRMCNGLFTITYDRGPDCFSFKKNEENICSHKTFYVMNYIKLT